MTAFAFPETDALSETTSMAGEHPFPHDDQVMPLDDFRELALMQRVKTGDFDSRQKLITGNLRQVLHSHERYAHSGAGIFDLLKAGNRGLVHALESFEPEGDNRFSAYAASCIRHHIEGTLKLEQQRKHPGLTPHRESRPASCSNAFDRLPGRCPN